MMVRTGQMLGKTTQGWRSLSHFEDGGGVGLVQRVGEGGRHIPMGKPGMRGSGGDSRGHVCVLREAGAWAGRGRPG